MNPNNGTTQQDEPSGRPSFLDELLVESTSTVSPVQISSVKPGITSDSSSQITTTVNLSQIDNNSIVGTNINTSITKDSPDSFFSFVNTATNVPASTGISPVSSPVAPVVPVIPVIPVTPPVVSVIPVAPVVPISQQIITPIIQASTNNNSSVISSSAVASLEIKSSPSVIQAIPDTTEILPGITVSSQPISPNGSIPKPLKNPITKGQIMRIIGSLFFVALIFFGSFLAYIVFNPEKASFFISFGINPGDIAELLVKLVNAIFGSITFGLSAIFIYFLFRVFLTKDAPKKRAVYIILSVFSGIALFSNIGFWAFLFREIGASDFVRPSGGIIVYDNDLLLSDKYKNNAELGPEQLANLIGPVTVRYDLSSDARFVSKFIDIESFEIDCNGDGSIEHEGVSPNDDSIICTYERRGSYSPRGTYIGKNTVTRDLEKRRMEFGIVKIAGVVDIKSTDNSIVFDATDLKNIGKLTWYTGQDFQTKVSSELKYTAKISDSDQFVCLALEKNKENTCKKVFSISSKLDTPIVGVIKYDTDIDNPMKFIFRVADAKSKSGGEIESYKWFLNDTDLFGNKETAEKLINSYGTYKISVELMDTAKNKTTLTEKIILEKPLQLSRSGNGEGSQLQIVDSAGNSMLKDAYNKDINAFKIGGFSVPTKMFFDATDVRVQNSGYELKEVEWNINKDIKKGFKMEYEFIGEIRYNIDITYIFARIDGKANNATIKERVIVEGKTPEITPKLDISLEGPGDLDNLFAPASVIFDASASNVKSGTISQFVYDFGEGKEPSEGEAVKTYLYSIPGEYTVTLTVVKDDGSKNKISRKLIIKNAPKKLVIDSSVSSGIVNKTVEFSTNGSVGNISTYEWDFGDGEKSNEPAPNHVYSIPGKYTIELKAYYEDGVIRSEKMDFEVSE